ncbi:MAG: hypothetical protein LIO46_04225 [Clostridiales bacterium]|nr:hypothetical protein [Clostridiales bacterium]
MKREVPEDNVVFQVRRGETQSLFHSSVWLCTTQEEAAQILDILSEMLRSASAGAPEEERRDDLP